MASTAARTDADAGAVPGQPRRPRVLAVDRYRGALVWLMVAGNYLGGVVAVPGFVKHTPDIGLSIADLVAPAFVFAMGINYGPSFARRRTAYGEGAAYRHFLLRYFAILGVGAFLSAGGTVVAGEPTTWGVLQALGEAGLIALVVIRCNLWIRLGVGVAVLVAYQLVLDHGGLASVLGTVQGGFLGGLSWGALLILSTAIADLWRRSTGALAIACGGTTVAAVVAVLVVPVSKNRVSLSYVLVTLAVAAIAFLLTVLGSRIVAQRAGYLAWWGENPLALYLIHLLLLALVVLPPVSWWYEGAPLWLAGLQLAAIMTLMSLIAWWLHRRRALVEA